VSIVSIEARIAHLERLAGANDDARAIARTEALVELSRRVLNAIRHLATGAAPSCLAERLLAESASLEDFVLKLQRHAEERRRR
jgi:hypothetical protein